MAVTAKFVSDFSAFYGDVTKAVGELKGFELQANKVEKQLGQMVTSFSGKQVIADAHLMAKAVEEAGGAAKLTASEMAKVNAVVTEAIEKYTALGQTAPKAMTDLAAATSATVKPMDALAAGMSQAGKTSADSARLIAGMSQAGQQAASSLKETTNAGGGFTSFLKSGNALLGVFGASLGVGALVQFGRTLLDDADALQKMSDRTGISIEGLQTLQRVGDDAGNTIEEMTGAINQMQNRLAGGDKSAAAAVDQLGLNLDQLLRMNPDRQFIAISDALRQIEDPAKQVQIAMDLFGKTGAQVLPSLKKGFDDVKDSAVGMSREAVEALDTVGDTLAKWWRQAKGITAEAALGFAHIVQAGFDPMKLGMQNAERELASMQRALKEAMAAADKAGPAFKGVAPPGLPDDLDHIYAVLDRQKDAFNASTEAAKKAAAEAKHLADEEKKLQEAIEKQIWDQVTDSINASKDATLEATKAIAQQFAPQLKELKVSLGIVTVAAQQTAGSMGLIADRSKEAADRINKDLEEQVVTKVEQLHKVLSPIEEVLGGIQTKFAQMAVVGARAIETISKRLAAGDWLGALTAGVTGAIQLFAGLFKSAESKINPLRKAFVDAAGGLDALRDKATEAGVTINALLSAKNAKEYQKAIDDLNLAFDEHAKDLERANELITQYGLTTEQLGAKWKAQELDTQVKGLMDDLRIMVDVLGLSMPDAIAEMGDKFQEAFNTAVKFGLELPQQMKPVLEKMVELGKLTDENGDVITDLKDTGVTFSETFSKSVDRLIEKFDEFMQKLGLVPNIINQIPDHKTIHFDYDVPPAPDFGGAPYHQGGVVMHTGGVVLPFVPRAHRGLAVDEVPIIAQRGEGILSKREMVNLGGVGGFNRFRRDLAAGSGPGMYDVLQQELQGLRAELRADRLQAPQKFARAVRDEVQKVNRRR